MGSKGKDSRVKLKHCISFPQYLLSAPRNNIKTNKKPCCYDGLNSNIKKVSATW